MLQIKYNTSNYIKRFKYTRCSDHYMKYELSFNIYILLEKLKHIKHTNKHAKPQIHIYIQKYTPTHTYCFKFIQYVNMYRHFLKIR